MTETSETHVVTELPAPKRHRFHNPFHKDEPAEGTETPARKGGPYGIYTAGLLLVAAGGVAAIASKFRKDNDEETESSSDATPTDS